MQELSQFSLAQELALLAKGSKSPPSADQIWHCAGQLKAIGIHAEVCFDCQVTGEQVREFIKATKQAARRINKATNKG